MSHLRKATGWIFAPPARMDWNEVTAIIDDVVERHPGCRWHECVNERIAYLDAPLSHARIIFAADYCSLFFDWTGPLPAPAMPTGIIQEITDEIQRPAREKLDAPWPPIGSS
jgi:hypothetical protein